MIYLLIQNSPPVIQILQLEFSLRKNPDVVCNQNINLSFWQVYPSPPPHTHTHTHTFHTHLTPHTHTHAYLFAFPPTPTPPPHTHTLFLLVMERSDCLSRLCGEYFTPKEILYNLSPTNGWCILGKLEQNRLIGKTVLIGQLDICLHN